MLCRVVILQDLENLQFLCPTPDGDVGFTPLITKAGMFEDEEEAQDTAEMMHVDNFQLFFCYVDLETKLSHRQ